MSERGTGPKSLIERSKGHQELGCCLVVSCVSKPIGLSGGVPYPPFYRPRGCRGYRQEKEECKENAPLDNLLWILVFDDQHNKIGLMNLQVIVL